jgi:tyrosine recombinase XerC
MEEALAEYVNYLVAERNASPHTIANYRREVGQFLAFAKAQGITKWDAVTPALLRRWLAWLHERRYAKASVVRRVSELRAFYRYLLEHGQARANPVEGISAPRLPKRLPRPLALAEVEALLAAPDTATPQGQRDRAMLELLYAAGLRVSELLALDMSALDLDHGEVRVLGKGAKERIVLIGQPAVRALRAYLADGRLRLLAGQPGRPPRAPRGGVHRPGAVFLNRFGRRLSVSMFTRRLGQYARGAGIEHAVTPHMLRHSFATHLLDGGADLRSVQELLGHESVATTQIYTEVSQRHLRDTVFSAHPRARRAHMVDNGKQSPGPSAANEAAGPSGHEAGEQTNDSQDSF